MAPHTAPMLRRHTHTHENGLVVVAEEGYFVADVDATVLEAERDLLAVLFNMCITASQFVPTAYMKNGREDPYLLAALHGFVLRRGGQHALAFLVGDYLDMGLDAAAQ